MRPSWSNLTNLAAGGRAVTLADNQGQGTIPNDDAATLSINDVSVTEGNTGTTQAIFTVTLDNAVDAAVNVDFATGDGTALAGSDYTAASGTLRFVGLAGETQTVTVDVVGETLVELDETFLVNLTNLVAGGRAVTMADSQGQGTIVE